MKEANVAVVPAHMASSDPLWPRPRFLTAGRDSWLPVRARPPAAGFLTSGTGARRRPPGPDQHRHPARPPPGWARGLAGHARPGHHDRMPRGPTRRLRRLLAQAPGTDPRRLVTLLGLPAVAVRLPAALTLKQLLDQAAHEAAVLRHPYVGPEHVWLAAAACVADAAVYRRLRTELLERAASGPGGRQGRGWLGTGWRPRGPRSAARRGGQRQLEAEQRRAQQRARGRPPPPGEAR